MSKVTIMHSFIPFTKLVVVMVGDHDSADMHCTNSQYKPPRPFFTSCTLSTSPRQSLDSTHFTNFSYFANTDNSSPCPNHHLHQFHLLYHPKAFINSHSLLSGNWWRSSNSTSTNSTSLLPPTPSILQPNSHPTQPPQPPTNTTQNSPIPLTLSSSIYFTNNSNVPINTAISTNFTHSADPRHSCIKLHSFHQLHLLYWHY